MCAGISSMNFKGSLGMMPRVETWFNDPGPEAEIEASKRVLPFQDTE
jgi:hypothetical protein